LDNWGQTAKVFQNYIKKYAQKIESFTEADKFLSRFNKRIPYI
jgi:hypothetical protein